MYYIYIIYIIYIYYIHILYILYICGCFKGNWFSLENESDLQIIYLTPPISKRHSIIDFSLLNSKIRTIKAAVGL